MDELDELRIEIAKVKGWRAYRVLYSNTPTFCIRDANGVLRSNLWYLTEDEAWKNIDRDRSDWPRDIAAAWELAEEMQAEFDKVNKPYGAQTYVQLTRQRVGWSFGVYWENAEVTHKQQILCQIGNAAPEAIARAYLAWKTAK